jgi:hypothetical protein
MSQFIIKKKKDVKENSENKNIIVLKDINMTILDTKYAMKEIKDNSLRKIIKVNKNVNSNSISDENDNIKTVEDNKSSEETDIIPDLGTFRITIEDKNPSPERDAFSKKNKVSTRPEISNISQKIENIKPFPGFFVPDLPIQKNVETEKRDILVKDISINPVLDNQRLSDEGRDPKTGSDGSGNTKLEVVNKRDSICIVEENKSSFVTKKIQRKKKDVEIHIHNKDENSIISNNHEINDLRSVTTKLEHLGISNEQKFNQFQSLIKNENINVKLYSSLPILKNDIDLGSGTVGTGRNGEIRDVNKDNQRYFNQGTGSGNPVLDNRRLSDEGRDPKTGRDGSGNKKSIPSKTNLYCWWCKYQVPFDIHPLGCPVKYHKKDLPEQRLQGQGTGLNEYFETDGIFCSFNCVCAYSNEVSIYNIRYKESGGLLYILYKKIFDTFPPNMNIVPALDWRLLKNFGGTMSIDDFRNNFQKIDNVSLNYIKHTQTIKLKDINIKQNSISYIDEKSKENLSNY